MSEPDFSLPPASFAFLVESIMVQTQMHMGIFNTGDAEDDQEPNLDIARHSIDLLAILQEKTRGNLTAAEQRLLENGLTELQFRFVQITQELQQAAEPAPPETPLIFSADAGKGVKTA